MGRPANKELIQKQIEGCLTVEQLIKILETFPADAFVGKVGHFGEFYALSENDLSLRESYIKISEPYVRKYVYVIVLDIETYDIGPGPA